MVPEALKAGSGAAPPRARSAISRMMKDACDLTAEGAAEDAAHPTNWGPEVRWVAGRTPVRLSAPIVATSWNSG